MSRAVVVLGPLLLLCACGGSSTPAAPTSAVATSTAPSVSPTTGAAAPTSPAPTSSSSAFAQAAYALTTQHLTGTSGSTTYDVVAPALGGGTPGVRDAVNAAVKASLLTQVGVTEDPATASTADPDHPVVGHLGAHVVSLVVSTSVSLVPPGAHPSTLLGTITFDLGTAKPITLQALFTDEQQGLDALAASVAKAHPTLAGSDEPYDASGTTATEANYANWIATPAGYEIHFQDYQVGPHAAGLQVHTVPWSDLSSVLAPGMLAVVSS